MEQLPLGLFPGGSYASNRSALACELRRFLVTVQELNLSILVSVLLLGFLALYRFHRPMVEALA